MKYGRHCEEALRRSNPNAIDGELHHFNPHRFRIASLQSLVRNDAKCKKGQTNLTISAAYYSCTVSIIKLF
jgi:hypothetical protein